MTTKKNTEKRKGKRRPSTETLKFPLKKKEKKKIKNCPFHIIVAIMADHPDDDDDDDDRKGGGAERIIALERATITGHDDRVWCLSFEPNRNELLATCSSDKTVKIWKMMVCDDDAMMACRCVCTLDGVHERTIRSVAWSPCGRYLASASFDATVAIYQRVDDRDDVTDGNDEVKFECVAALEGHENEVKSCAWSPSGSLLATCGRDKSVWIWESAPGNHFECVAVLHGHTQDVKKVKWHETEDVLYSASYDDTVKTWKEDLDGDDWSCSGTTKAHESTVWDLTQERVRDGGGLRP